MSTGGASLPRVGMSTVMARGGLKMEQSGAADQAKEKVGQAGAVAQEKAQQAAGQAKGRLREQVDERSTQAGEQLSSTAGDVRTVGEELRQQGKDQPAKLADQAAERAERLGGYLKDSDADRILGDVEELARKQPWAVAAGGLALGFLASRFLKASSEKRYQSSAGEPETGRELGYAGATGEITSPAAPPVTEAAQAGQLGRTL